MDLSFQSLLDLVMSERVLPWVITLVVTLAGATLFATVKAIVAARLRRFAERTSTTIDDLVLGLVERSKTWVFGTIVAYTAARAAGVPAGPLGLIWILVVVSVAIQAALWGNALVQAWVDRALAKQKDSSPSTATTVQALSYVARVAVWTIVGLLAVQNLGYDITALMAGLGVGGIAVALAVQSILGDLFAALSIALDKPFVIGDFVVIGEFAGTVERIGLKTTRVRSLSGEQLVFSNSDLLSSRIRNYKLMQERRVAFTFGVTYQTPVEVIEQIPAIVREIVDTTEHARFDRAHFKSFGASSLDFEVVYFVDAPDYTLYMDVQQAINLALMRKLAELRTDFAYPTQTLHIETVPDSLVAWQARAKSGAAETA